MTEPAAGSLRAVGVGLALPFRAAPVTAATQLLLTVLAGAMPAAAAWATKLMIDELSGGGSGNAGRVVLLALVGIVTGGLATALLYFTGYLAEVVRRRVTFTVEGRLFARTSSLSGLTHVEDPAFHDRLRLAEQAAQEAPGAIAALTQELLRATVVFAGFTGVLLVVWPPMTLLLLATAGASVLARLATARREARTAEAWVAADRRRLFYRALLTDVRAAKEIRLFGLGSLLYQRMMSSLEQLTQARLRVERRGMLMQSALTVVGAVATGLGALVVVVGAVHGRFTAGDVVLFLAAVSAVQGGLVGVVLQLGEASTAVRLLRHYLDVVSTVDDLGSGDRIPSLRDGIELHDVWFRYSDDGPWVLRGVNLVIPAGSAVGLVGVNGAGKSTLVKLLCRFYDPQRGWIRWDGVDIRELDLTELRGRVSVIFQEFMTYDLTAAENIGLGRVERIEDRRMIRDAAAQAEIDRVLEALPRGYDTLLSRTYGDDAAAGVTLSGGQWQRVALARGLVRTDADLLVLDEPTAGLDAEGEYRVHATLRAHAAGRTRLLISHRLAALRDADVVVTLAGGRIVERGSHDELMTAGGEYARLFRLQAGGYQDERVSAG